MLGARGGVGAADTGCAGQEPLAHFIPRRRGRSPWNDYCLPFWRVDRRAEPLWLGAEPAQAAWRCIWQGHTACAVLNEAAHTRTIRAGHVDSAAHGIPSLSVSLTEGLARRLRIARSFSDRGLLIVDAAVREAAEAAVRVQEDLLGAVNAQRLLGPATISSGVSTSAVRGLTTPRPISRPPSAAADDRDVAGARGGVLENELPHLHRLEGRQKRRVVARKEHLLLRAPVPPADVDADPGRLDPLDDPVDQFGRVFQLLTRVPAGGQGRSHEGAAASSPPTSRSR